ncbi:MAG TPA: hypothetical protein ENK57_11455, partial [Polyangiaceae bacterium]|nr:hypothetical protein [Polyangiaceae bacterium]
MGVRTRWWSALALLTGCSAAPPPIDDAISPPETIDVTPETSRAPSSGWRYHPRETAEVLNGIELPDGRWLLVTELGERWLTDGPARRASGEEVIPLGAEAAVHRAGEPLEHVVPWRPHQRPTTSTHPSHGADWLFVGESGRSYFAAEPLGPLTPGPTAPRSVVAITPTRSGAWAVDVVGRSLRLDGGAWEPMPDRDRPRLFAIAQQREGQLLALSLPERYWRSDDDGDRWSPLDTAPVGALRLVTDRHGAVVADGSTGAWRLAPDGAMSRMTDAPIHAASLVVRPHRGPSARSVANGSATLVSDDYVEVVPTDDGWNLVRGRLGERLDVRPLRLERRCDRAVVATAHAHLWAACIEE